MTAQPTESGRATELSRRSFIKHAGVGVAAVAFTAVGVPGLLKSPAFPTMAGAQGVIMPDPKLCIGCLSCEVACSDVHRDAGMSDVSRIRIFNLKWVEPDPEIIDNYGERGSFVQQPCVQCPDAPCLAVCPVDALQVEGTTGARIIKEDLCIACGKCATACIFPTLDESLSTNSEIFQQRSRITYDPKKNVYTKCDLCYFRPEGPACIQRCPINIRINQGIIESDVMCLDLPPMTDGTFRFMEQQQHVSPEAPAPGQQLSPANKGAQA
jgi:Fe-S-cluster-containing hydrogenase component 2